MTETINIHVVEDNRNELSKFGSVFAKGIFSPSKVGVINDFGSQERAAQENMGLFITRNVQRFKVDKMDIIGIRADKDIDGSNVVVITGIDASGNKKEVRCPIANSKFTKEATDENLAKALKGDDMFFASGKKVEAAINRLNNKELASIDALIEMLQGARRTVEQTIDANKAKIEKYYKELDKETTTVNINVDVD